ncbi:aminoglycoside phosphotransferase family protein [Mesobacillus subterraneus]|uniref:phosphotransferase n=1 Tax=Mesobacillus subterraneus TaxID=285983 RepID=UPI00203FF023|nr:phosphotransferase [Mesobacillus subterraneus]MCM3664879.1 aminoglycoside phosphotransferase family protein [Mesobacillus subterraneus]MCM3681967.1 aminoglycoside phosphotransferase family protein [Mesobacillus subterraneus]
MDISIVLKELKDLEYIKDEKATFSKLSGGTVSEIYLVNSNLVVKANNPKIVEAEAVFLDYYSGISLLPRLFYKHSENEYLVYSYIKGKPYHPRNNKQELLISLVKNVLNQYKASSWESRWGWIDEPAESWKDFIVSRISEAENNLQFTLLAEDHKLVHSLINKQGRYSTENPFLLHGDCGVHNFIFEDGELCGVIDPSPVIGPPVYDLIYAFCSSPDSLTKETIDSAAIHLLEKGELFNEEILVGLYLRISTCIKHHPEDLNEYLAAWEYWKKIVEEG